GGQVAPACAGGQGASPAGGPPGRGIFIGASPVVRGVGPIVRVSGRSVGSVPAGPARRGVLAGPGQPGTPASTGTGQVGLIRFSPAAATVSLGRPGLLVLRPGPRTVPYVPTRPL